MKKFWIKEESGDVNITPLMNIVMLLIPFLLMASEFIRIGTINTVAPMTRPGPQPDPPIIERKLNLTLALTKKGMTLLTAKGSLTPACVDGNLSLHPKGPGNQHQPTFPKQKGDYNHKSLQKCLSHLKKKHPKEERITLMVEESIPYQQVVSAMDTTRVNAEGKILFPKVLFSAGVY